jgi:predicted peptidase
LSNTEEKCPLKELDRPKSFWHHRGGRLIKYVLLWATVNLVAWYTPQAWNSGGLLLKQWRQERIASLYETGWFQTSSLSSRLPFLFYEPKRPTASRLPLVVVLHGAGHRGNDGLTHTPILETFLIEADFQNRHPCFVLAPQCPVNMTWYSGSNNAMNSAVTELIAMIESRYMIDSSRVYLMGHSMGAYGCWHYATTMPSRFAAVIAVAGGGDESRAALAAQTPIWAIHGEDDKVIPLAESQAMVDAINAQGGEATLTLLPKVGHDSWKVFQNAPQIYLDWMFSKRTNSKSNENEKT